MTELTNSATVIDGELADAISFCFELAIYSIGLLRFIFTIEKDRYEMFVGDRKSFVELIGAADIGWSNFRIVAYYFIFRLVQQLELLLTITFSVFALYCIILMLHDFNLSSQSGMDTVISGVFSFINRWIFAYVDRPWSINFMLISIPAMYIVCWSFARMVLGSWPDFSNQSEEA